MCYLIACFLVMLCFNSIFVNSTCKPDLSEKIFLGSTDTDMV